MRRAAVLIALAACQSPSVNVTIPQPSFSALVEVPDLAGEIVVARTGGEVIARGTLEVDGAGFSGRVPEMPVDEDLEVSLVWRSRTIVVAQTLTPRTVRVEKGKTTTIEFATLEYEYPDDDGDGAFNIHEVAFAAANPDAGDPVADPELAPDGFYDALVEVIDLPAYPTPSALSSGRAIVGTQDWDVTTLRDHAVSVINLADRKRSTSPIPCSDQDLVVDVAVNDGAGGLWASAVCGPNLYAFQLSAPTFAPAETEVLPFAVTQLVHSESGHLLFALSRKRIVALRSETGTPPYEQVQLHDASAEDVAFERMAVNEDVILVGDSVAQGIAVAARTPDGAFEYIAHALPGQLQSPGDIAIHPLGERAYIASGDGFVRALNVASPNPAGWTVTSTINLGAPVLSLAIEPSAGAWLYAVTLHRIVRIDTLTNRVTWDYSVGGAEHNQLVEVSLSGDGSEGVVVGAEQALYRLGQVGIRAGIEIEPNNSEPLANAIGDASSVVGWIDNADDGDLDMDWLVWSPGGTTSTTDDIEDLWRVDTTGVEDSLLLGVFPMASLSSIAIARIDGTSAAERAQWVGGVELAPGAGVFTILPPGSLGGDLLIGVAALDIGVAFTPYEIILSPVTTPSSVPEATDFPGDASAPEIYQGVLPWNIVGSVEAADAGVTTVGTDDMEDCLAIPLTGRRVGLHLAFGTSDDLNLYIFDPDGVRWPDQYAYAEEGIAEFMIFEPKANPGSAVACVAIDDVAYPASSVDYSLTVVDFGR